MCVCGFIYIWWGFVLGVCVCARARVLMPFRLGWFVVCFSLVFACFSVCELF